MTQAGFCLNRFRCKDCEDFDYCGDCFKVPEITVKHKHMKDRFVDVRILRGDASMVSLLI